MDGANSVLEGGTFWSGSARSAGSTGVLSLLTGNIVRNNGDHAGANKGGQGLMPNWNRREMLAGLGTVGTGVLPTGCATEVSGFANAPRSAKPMNILLIVTDQEMNFSTFPEGLLARLPGRSALLERGTHVANYHVHTTPCSPSRSNIYTGQHTQKTRIYENSNTVNSATLPEAMPTIGDMLRAAGYHTSYKGKWHLSSINGKRDWNQEVRRVYPDTEDALEAYGFSNYGFDGESVGLTWAGHNDDGGVASDAAALIRQFRDTDKTAGKPGS